jgi:hypothetical protein
MMSEVLRDHPKSAKAHYVRAELYAEQRNSLVIFWIPAAAKKLRRWRASP